MLVDVQAAIRAQAQAAAASATCVLAGDASWLLFERRFGPATAEGLRPSRVVVYAKYWVVNRLTDGVSLALNAPAPAPAASHQQTPHHDSR
jgi:hypothetical protein